MPGKDVLGQLTSALQSLTDASDGRRPARRELVLAATCAKLVQELSRLSTEALLKATVINVLAPNQTPDTSVAIGTGMTVKVLASTDHRSTIGQTGIAINDTVPDGQVLVIFENGEYGLYRAHADGDQPAELEPVRLGARLVISFDTRMIEVAKPEGLDISAGQSVWINQATMQVISLADPADTGQVLTVERAIEGGRVEITLAGQRFVAKVGPNVQPVQVGHRVLLEPSLRVVVANFGHDDGRFHPTKFKPVAWTDIGGYEETKQELQALIDEAFDPGPLEQAYGLKPIHGFLLHGPGGTGKTMMVRAFYTALLAKYAERQVTEHGFFVIEGAELLEGIVGETEKLLRRTANRAEDFWRRHQLPAVILINEIDAIGKKRGTGISTDVNDTNVPMLLSLMDGFEQSNIIWIFVTNRVDVLDPELIRDGRMDRVIHMPRPDPDAARAIFEIHLNPLPLRGFSVKEMAEQATKALFSPEQVLYDLVLRVSDGTTENRQLTFGDVASGALIANAVQEAARRALRRDKQAQQSVPSKVAIDDVIASLLKIFAGKKVVNLDNDVRAFLGEDSDRLIAARRRLRQVKK